MNSLKSIRLLYCKILVISLLATFMSPNYAFAFVISSEEDCIGNTYQFNFPKTFSFITGGESFRVHVSNSTLDPDIRIRIVSDPSQADLFLVDSYTNADMAVCISDRIGFGNNVTNITLENTSFNADLKIRASTFESQPDHRLFLQSSRFDESMAMALFAVVWKSSQELVKQVPAPRLQLNQPDYLNNDYFNDQVMKQHNQMQRSLNNSLFGN